MPPNRHGKGSRACGDVAAFQHPRAAGEGIANQGLPHVPAPGAVPGRSPASCCLPTGCPRLKEEPIFANDPGDAVKVFCNNEACDQAQWMHAICFGEWEQHVLAYLRSCGRARSWSEKQRLQNLWTKKGYDLAFKACDCKCGRGHIRKDLDYIPPAKDDKKPKRHRKKSNVDKPQGPIGANRPVNAAPPANGTGAHVAGGPSGGNQGPKNHSTRPQLRVRTSSFSSTGSSPPSSAGTPPLTPGSGKKGSKFDFFADTAQAAAGNIFRRRSDFSVFNLLPRHQQNAYHIKMEDEGPHGNDETRCFVLTNLSTHQVTNVSCVVCQTQLPVFDKYPLIDGTFFLSPQRYNTDLQVLFDHRMLYMNSVCMRCLTGVRELRCRACRTAWQGSMLVIGTMYSYDIFAAMPCCARRLSCKNCCCPIIDPGCAFQFFSEYSKAIQCPHCKADDYHFIKPLQETYVIKQPIRLC